MKKIIILSMILNTLHIQCMHTEEKIVIATVVAGFVGYALYDNLIKDPNLKLEEEFLHKKNTCNVNLNMGMQFMHNEKDKKEELLKYLSSLENPSEAQQQLIKHYSSNN